MSESQPKTLSLFQVLAKASYQIQITKPEDTEFTNPIAFGSGFMLSYKQNTFFVTADHNIHIDDYDINERTGIDNRVSIFNNINTEELSSLVSPIGGFYYMEKYDLSKPNESPELFDVAACIIQMKEFKAPFLTENIYNSAGELLVKANESKILLGEEHLNSPNTENEYFIYGKIKPKISGISLLRSDSLKEGLKFIREVGDYLLFNSADTINSSEEWAGLSGSPVFSKEGFCVGVLCSVNEGTHSIWVKSFEKIKVLLDTAISQEALIKEKNANKR